MTYNAEAAAIRSRFSTSWGSTTPIAWPNVTFTPPNGSPWVRLSILTAGADQTEIGPAGSRTFRHDGTVSVQVFVPANTGDGAARSLAEQACAVFRGVTAGGIVYTAPYVTEGGHDGAGWYMLNVWCPYRRDSRF